MADQGRSCEAHINYGVGLEENVVVHLRKVQVLGAGREETASAAFGIYLHSDG